MRLRDNLDIDQSLSGPSCTYGASVCSCLIYLNKMISYQNRNVKTHLWQLSQFSAVIIKDLGASLAPVDDIGNLTTLTTRLSCFSPLLI